VQFGAFLATSATENVQLRCLVLILGDRFGDIRSSKVAQKGFGMENRCFSGKNGTEFTVPVT